MSMIGKTVGTFECTSLLGRGGMGEVYRAKDKKLGRDVAIKVLPEEFAMDADRVARFQREAKLLASLNHTNIASIYGLEESDGTHFLVLELIEGDTLADRLKHGAIPVEESLKLALQIAEALEAAHEKGVIHRDLKPANIKVTPDGKVKVLDFGLAKAFAGEQGDLNLSNSPTLSAAATEQGIILGTAGYMSPEQARGKPVDKHTDIWAFGVVLYEMLTGQSAFRGEDVGVTLASVIKSDANLALLPPSIHPRIREVITRCLQKEQKKRYADISDVQYEIEQVLADPGGMFAQSVTAEKPRKNPSLKLPWVAVIAILGVIVAAAAVWYLKPSSPPEPRRIVRLDHALPNGQQFHQVGLNRHFTLAVSSDGGQFAYSTTDGLYVRSVDSFDARLIAGTDGSSCQPFFSPDGEWIGYASLTDMQLKKLAISGGAPIFLCNSPSIGAVWNADNTIVYAEGYGGGVRRVSANGGTTETLLEEPAASFPQLLPDKKSVMFTDSSSSPSKIVVQSLESKERKELFAGEIARYLATGHIIYLFENNLFAIPFNPDTIEVSGGPISMVEDVSEYAVSDSGTLVYLPGTASATAPRRTLVWVSRDGKEESIPAAPNDYGDIKISPDGSRVALSIGTGGNEDIWVWDLVRETMTRLTFDDAVIAFPIWTPDSKKIIYSSTHALGKESVYWKSADGAGEVEELASNPDQGLSPMSLSADGKILVLSETDATTRQMDIGMISMEGDRKMSLLLNEKYHEFYPQISPDGRWMAYMSNESGKDEVYVRPFPEVDKGKWQVSANGGDSPLWSPDGRELFYHSGNSFMAVDVEIEPTFKPGKSRVLFKGNYYIKTIPRNFVLWDISPDGKRFLMIKPETAAGPEPAEAAPRKINIVVNWSEELKERVPVD